MRNKYLIYPDALKKLKESGIEARVNELKNSEEGISFIGGHTSPEEIVANVKYLEKEGFYKYFSKKVHPEFKKSLNKLLNKPNDFSWKIQKKYDLTIEPCELEDLLLFTGDIASMVLKPKEIWDYSKFRFSSPNELVSIVGAYILQESRLNYNEGYKWTTKRNNGSEIITEITGDMNSDLRIFQTDIAPYPTTDLFGNSISMRPETHADRQIIAPYHTTEGSLLVAIMKYIEQKGIQTEYQKDNAKQLIKWGNSLGQGGGTCTEHFGGCDQSPILFFAGYEYPIPKLNESNETNKYTNHWIFLNSDAAYGTYIAENGDFVLSYQNREEMKNPLKQINMRFLPEDAEHIVKGLIYQSAKGLGRTSARQLLDILKYRYSSKFEEDQNKYR